jgi:hypothetical protein
MKRTRILNTPWAAAALAVTAVTLAHPSAHAATVWNANIGDHITTGDSFTGAAPENNGTKFWNSITPTNPFTSYTMPLANSEGASSSATLTLTGAVDIGYTNGLWAGVSGPEIFSQWIKETTNSIPFSMTIGGLGAGTYDLVIYSDWYWPGANQLPVTLTAGSGLTGTAYLNNIPDGDFGTAAPLTEDPAFGSNDSTVGNWMRITGLTPDGSGNLGFSMGGTNAAFNGFQLVQVPEPSAALLGGLGLLALLRRRR